MGYALNLCNTHISVVPYNQNIGKEGIHMAQDRVRIADVADSLGLSTATVSKVIHGKTEKISDETVKRVQQELERSGYIPNMAAILLARNNSRIIGVVVNDNEKYEGRVLEDGFVMASINALSHEVNEKGYFLMIKTTSDIREIPCLPRRNYSDLLYRSLSLKGVNGSLVYADFQLTGILYFSYTASTGRKNFLLFQP